MCYSRKVFLKHQVNCNKVSDAIHDFLLCPIWSVGNPVEVLNEYLLLVVVLFVPTNVTHVRNHDKPWFDDQCWHAFGLKQVSSSVDP